jgi:arylsulfatase A
MTAMIRLSCLFVAVVFSSIAAAADPPPNFVLINIDDLGYGDIAPFGSTNNRTPHLDRMAVEGRKLTCFYGAPVCSPSRSSLMTGCYPKRVGIPRVLFPGQATGLNAKEHTLPELLKERGYATACIGKWHLGDQPEFLPTRHGFDYYYGIPYSNDMGPAADGSRSDFGAPLPAMDRTNHPPLPLLRNETLLKVVKAVDQTQLVRDYTYEAIGFLKDHKNGPFFLYVPHSAVHFPIYPGDSFRGKNPHGLYSDWVEEVDWSVGQILEAVRSLGLSDRTLVVFTSDNGGTRRGSNAPLRGFKASTFEGGMREPTIALWPGRVPAGTETAEVASMMDLLPTFVKLAGGTVPTDVTIDGRDIWPLMSGETGAKSPHEVFYYFNATDLKAVRDARWKLEVDTGKLYDLVEDIAESKDVSKQHPDVVARLHQVAAAARADLGDGQPGPGCREPGMVQKPRPIVSHEGVVREEFRKETNK